MTELYWPLPGGFIDWERDFRVDESGVYDVPDDAEEQYRERGWTDPSEADDSDAKDAQTASGGNSMAAAAESEQSPDENDANADENADATDADAEADAGDQPLDDMAYDELQSLAKENDIPANQSASDLRDELREEGVGGE